EINRLTILHTNVLLIGGVTAIISSLILLFNLVNRNFKEQIEVEKKVLLAHNQLETVSHENDEHNWLLIGASTIAQAVRDEHRKEHFTVESLVTILVTKFATYSKAQIGAIYLADDAGEILRFMGGYAFHTLGAETPTYTVGQGLIGQSAIEGKMIIYRDVNDDHIKITTGLGNSHPKSILIQPLYALGRLKAVIELGFSGDIPPAVEKFMES